MPDHSEARMKITWNTLARRSAMHYIATGRTDWDVPSFLESGKETVREAFGRVDAVPGEGPAGTVLDLGCGIGRVSFALAEHYDKIIGVDVSEEMICRANELKRELNIGNVEFYCNNGSDLSLIPDGSCDLVFSYIVLQHIPSKQVMLAYISEFGRVLKPGGHALFQLPIYKKNWLVYPWRLFQFGFRQLLWRLEDKGLVVPEKGVAFRGSRLGVDELERRLQESNLKVLRISKTPSAYRFCDDTFYFCSKSMVQ